MEYSDFLESRKQRSVCCGAPAIVCGDENEGTNFYVCTDCWKACDIEPDLQIYKGNKMNIEKIKLAMVALEQMPCGGIIGSMGATQTELDQSVEDGIAICEDGVYHNTQQAWLYLNDFLNEIK